MAGQEVLYEELQEIKELIKRKNSTIRRIFGKIIGKLISWGIEFFIKPDEIKRIWGIIIEGVKLRIGN